MSISITPALPVTVTQAIAPDVVLQSGTVVDAQVIKLLANNLVQIALANLSLDVVSEVPLQVGQSLQLAVSQTQDGIKLSVVGQGGNATGADAAGVSSGGSLPTNASAVATPSAVAVPNDVLTPVERQAVISATQSAAPQQASLAPLFANLSAVAASSGLPLPLQQAIAQVLSQRTNLDQNLDGNDIRNAVQKSGLFLEASLASGSGAVASGTPDLKAALIVLRQTLASLTTSASGAQSPSVNATAASGTLTQGVAAPIADALAATAEAAPPLLPELVTPENSLLPGSVAAADDFWQSAAVGRIVSAASLLEGAPSAGAALNLLQEALQASPRDIGDALVAFGSPANARNADAAQRSNLPPPPFRGALPSAQSIASPSIAADAPLATTARHLLGDTDSAIARQTLLQAASLPDRADSGTLRNDAGAPKWNFEIPFATPMGTAMAQFEISRDGGGREAEAAAPKSWRARFSIDVEPAGPVHALVTLAGDKTSVRMWAERPSTAQQLRAGAAQLGQALSKAELQPGDIVIRDGTPPQPAPAAAGHFLDRAL